ncbi:MAG: hypothetical protein AAF902_24655 [Chloroflexota bacterium]
MAKRNASRSNYNGQRRLAVTLTVGSFAASVFGARLIAADFNTELEEDIDVRDEVAPLDFEARDPYSLDLQPIPTVAAIDQSGAEAYTQQTFTLELEPVPTVDGSQIEIEEPVKAKSKSSK